MADPMVSEIYRTVQARLSADLRAVPERDFERPAPACPAWTVKGVLSHLIGNVDDFNAGRLKGPPYDVQNARQVAERADVPIVELLDHWDAVASDFADAIADTEPPLAMVDLCVHEFDIRAPLGDTRHRDSPVVAGLVGLYAGGVDVGQPLCIVTDTQTIGDPGAQLTLQTTDYELFRAMSGRRSAAQVKALDWSSDIGDEALRLCLVDQLSDDDIIE